MGRIETKGNWKGKRNISLKLVLNTEITNFKLHTLFSCKLDKEWILNYFDDLASSFPWLILWEKKLLHLDSRLDDWDKVTLKWYYSKIPSKLSKMNEMKKLKAIFHEPLHEYAKKDKMFLDCFDYNLFWLFCKLLTGTFFTTVLYQRALWLQYTNSSANTNSFYAYFTNKHFD